MTSDEISKMSFEEALKEFEDIVRDLESGNVTLDASINAYERGVKLKRHCETRLNEARTRVEKISAAPDGTVTASATEIG